MSEVENEKDFKFIKIITIIIIYTIIGIVALFTFCVTKVKAVTVGNNQLNYYTWDWQLGGGKQCNNLPCQLELNSATNSSYRLNNYAFEVDVQSSTWATASFNFNVNYEVQYNYPSSAVVNLDLQGIRYYFLYGNNQYYEVTNGCSSTGTQSVKSGTLTIKTYNITTICSFITPPANSSHFLIRIPAPSYNNGNATMVWSYRSIKLNVSDRTWKDSGQVTDTDKIKQALEGQTNTIINNNNSNTDRIVESNNETKESIDDVNDTLNDESMADLNNIQVTTADDSAISDLLLLPITLANIIINADSGSCVDYTIGSLFGHTLKFKCIDFENMLGSNLYHTIDIFMAFFMIYEVVKMIITAFNDLTSLRDSFDDLYTPAHQGYATKHGGGARV